MVEMVKCGRCGKQIDRGACGQAFAIITIKDDRANDPEKYKQERIYLCDDCVTDLQLFLLRA